jgi:hypothetical protein
MFHASSAALTRLATDKRFIGTDLPGFTGVLPPWGRQLQSHPHSHSIVPGGGLAADRTAWLPSRATFFVPVTALSLLSRAICKDNRRQAGLLAHSDPQVWAMPWNVHRQAKHPAHAAFPSLAPSVFKVAISNPRLVSLTDRTVTFTYRKVGRARFRTAQLDVLEFIRRFLQHVLPHGFRKVRHFGLFHARCAVPLATTRLRIGPGHSSEGRPPLHTSPPPRVARCPTWGAPMRIVMRLWTSHRDLVDTG